MRELRRGRPFWMAGVLLVSAACGSSSQAGESGTSAEQARRTEPQPLVRKECTGGASQPVDANGDGTPDIKHHMDGGKRVCTEIDMNFDGKTDVLRFYQPDGQSIALEQHDYDFDGKLDEQAHFEAGALKSKELDTDFDGIIDTWLWCNGPFVDRAERARRKPGHVDTLESYKDGVISEIQYDEDLNGKPEKCEIYEDGTLTSIRYDDNGDGTFDRTEQVENEYDKDTPVSCDGSALPAGAGVKSDTSTSSGGEAQPNEAEKELQEDTGQSPTENKPTDDSAAKPADAAAKPEDAKGSDKKSESPKKSPKKKAEKGSK
jgi:hypothetical protein